MTYIDAKTTDPQTCLDLMVRMMQAAFDLHLATQYPGFEPYKVDYSLGKKYAKVFVDNGTQRSVCFFVDRVTGDVWKGSWKAPVLNFTRGNILTVEGRAAIIGDRTAQGKFYYYGGM